MRARAECDAGSAGRVGGADAAAAAASVAESAAEAATPAVRAEAASATALEHLTEHFAGDAAPVSSAAAATSTEALAAEHAMSTRTRVESAPDTAAEQQSRASVANAGVSASAQQLGVAPPMVPASFTFEVLYGYSRIDSTGAPASTVRGNDEAATISWRARRATPDHGSAAVAVMGAAGPPPIIEAAARSQSELAPKRVAAGNAAVEEGGARVAKRARFNDGDGDAEGEGEGEGAKAPRFVRPAAGAATAASYAEAFHALAQMHALGLLDEAAAAALRALVLHAKPAATRAVFAALEATRSPAVSSGDVEARALKERLLELHVRNAHELEAERVAV